MRKVKVTLDQWQLAMITQSLAKYDLSELSDRAKDDFRNLEQLIRNS